MENDLARAAVCGGAQNALITLLRHWTDDNEVNRRMVLDLLAASIAQAEGLI